MKCESWMVRVSSKFAFPQDVNKWRNVTHLLFYFIIIGYFWPDFGIGLATDSLLFSASSMDCQKNLSFPLRKCFCINIWPHCVHHLPNVLYVPIYEGISAFIDFGVCVCVAMTLVVLRIIYMQSNWLVPFADKYLSLAPPIHMI